RYRHQADAGGLDRGHTQEREQVLPQVHPDRPTTPRRADQAQSSEAILCPEGTDRQTDCTRNHSSCAPGTTVPPAEGQTGSEPGGASRLHHESFRREWDPDSAEATAASSTTGRDQTPKRALRKRGCLAGRSSGQAALVTLELDPRDPRGSLGENRCRV